MGEAFWPLQQQSESHLPPKLCFFRTITVRKFCLIISIMSPICSLKKWKYGQCILFIVICIYRQLTNKSDNYFMRFSRNFSPKKSKNRTNFEKLCMKFLNFKKVVEIIKNLFY